MQMSIILVFRASINGSYACNCINHSCPPSYKVLCPSQCLEKPMNPPPTTQSPRDLSPPLLTLLVGINANVQLDFITLLDTHCLFMLNFSSIWLLYSKSSLDKQWVPSNVVFANTIFIGHLLLSPFPYSSYNNQVSLNHHRNMNSINGIMNFVVDQNQQDYEYTTWVPLRVNTFVIF